MAGGAWLGGREGAAAGRRRLTTLGHRAHRPPLPTVQGSAMPGQANLHRRRLNRPTRPALLLTAERPPYRTDASLLAPGRCSTRRASGPSERAASHRSPRQAATDRTARRCSHHSSGLFSGQPGIGSRSTGCLVLRRARTLSSYFTTSSRTLSIRRASGVTTANT